VRDIAADTESLWSTTKADSSSHPSGTFPWLGRIHTASEESSTLTLPSLAPTLPLHSDPGAHVRAEAPPHCQGPLQSTPTAPQRGLVPSSTSAVSSTPACVKESSTADPMSSSYDCDSSLPVQLLNTASGHASCAIINGILPACSTPVCTQPLPSANAAATTAQCHSFTSSLADSASFFSSSCARVDLDASVAHRSGSQHASAVAPSMCTGEATTSTPTAATTSCAKQHLSFAPASGCAMCSRSDSSGEHRHAHTLSSTLPLTHMASDTMAADVAHTEHQRSDHSQRSPCSTSAATSPPNTLGAQMSRAEADRAYREERAALGALLSSSNHTQPPAHESGQVWMPALSPTTPSETSAPARETSVSGTPPQLREDLAAVLHGSSFWYS
jgi:hypothetical protein